MLPIPKVEETSQTLCPLLCLVFNRITTYLGTLPLDLIPPYIFTQAKNNKQNLYGINFGSKSSTEAVSKEH